MNAISEWIAQCQQYSSREIFSNLFPYPFLLIERMGLERVDQMNTSEIGEVTEVMRLKTTSQMSKIIRNQIPQYSEVRSVEKRTDCYPEKITIGRTIVNDIQLEYTAISRFHAFFNMAEDSYYLTDVGSKNGTWVNEKRLAPYTPIMVREYDVIVLGQVVRLKFLFPFSFYSYIMLCKKYN